MNVTRDNSNKNTEKKTEEEIFKLHKFIAWNLGTRVRYREGKY